MTVDIVGRAKQLAHEAHEGQLLYQKKAPMMVHIEEVVNLVRQAGGSAVEIAAAWLHDVVEDTPVTLHDVREKCGGEVASIVNELTDHADLQGKPEAERKQLQAERIHSLSREAKLVKLADQASNCRLAGTEHRSWDIPKTLIYIDGARKIAENCSGISTQLDTLFEKYYHSTRQTLLAEAKIEGSTHAN